MKKLFTLVLMCSLMIGSLAAQSPNAFKYQAVVRNNVGQLIVNQNVGFRISILQSSASGTAVYVEKHTAFSNSFGVVNLEIGNGTKLSGSFSTINWGMDSYFVKIDLDATNSGLFSEMGTSQLLAVPYAMYASKVGNGFAGSYLELSDKPLLFSGNYNDLSNKPTLSKVATSGKYVDLLEKPDFAAIATTGSFADLLNKPNFVTTSTSLQSGDILYYNGTAWSMLPRGVNGQTLRIDNGLPKWGEPGYALPMVTTNVATDVLQTGATSGGNVIATGYSDITARGVCWSINQNPTTADGKTNEAVGIGTFTSKLTGLLPNTTYYVRAYATNSAGTAYGNQVTLKTFLTSVFPTVTTSAINNITANAATSGGNVTATGGAEVSAQGVCWSLNQNPTIADNKTNDGNGTGQYQSQITNLSPGTKYYVRSYATNNAGTGYGNQLEVTTSKIIPVLTTKAITDISALGAVSGGIISSTGGGTMTSRGICWSDTPNPTIANDKTTSSALTTTFSAAFTKATPGTTYYVRAFATNEIGTGYGDQKSFTTSDAAYYQSFETGLVPVGWAGYFKVNNESAFDGSFSMKSLDGIDSDETLTITLVTSGQISFYYSFNGGDSMSFFIDNLEIQKYYNNGVGWQQGLFSLTSGVHKLNWKFYHNYYNGGKCYIDQIIITK